MKGGEIHIAVTAQMQAFEKSMQEVEQRARGVGGKFADNFAAGAESMMGKLTKMFAGPMIFAGIADGIADLLKNGGSVQQKVEAFLDGIPLLGSFTRLGKELEKTLSGERLDVMQSQVQYEEQALADAAFQNALAAEKKLLAERDSLQAQRESLELRKIADPLQRAEVEYAREVAKLEEQTARMVEQSEAGLVDNVEFNAFLKVQNEKKKILDLEHREKLDKIDLENIRAMEQAMELGEKIRKENAKTEEERFEESKKNSEKLVDAYSKQMDEIQKQMKPLEDAVREVGRATTSSSTALGSFTISSYTDAEKKKIDSESLKELKRLRQSMENVGASGGFR
jgi:hypothetical protein